MEKGMTIARRKRAVSRWKIFSKFGDLLLKFNAGFGYFFLYIPIAVLIVLSFNQSKFITVWRGFSIKWYIKLFHDAPIGFALKNTLIVSITTTILSTIFGTMAALALSRYKIKLKSAFMGLLYLPIIIPDIAMAVMLLLFYIAIHAPREIPWPWNLYTIIIGHIAFDISFVAVVVLARLADFDYTLEEAARDLYANEWQTFWKVTFPLILPGIMGGALLAFTLSVDDFVITFFTAAPGSNTLPLYIYGMIKKSLTPEINALSTLMVLASMSLVLMSLLLQKGESGSSSVEEAELEVEPKV